MRDIVGPNAAPKGKTDYRSYRDFLESYKDDQESVSSTDSGVSSYRLSESRSNNTSTSSLNSETNGSGPRASKSEQGFASRTGSFRNYLETYSNKKFSSVKPLVPKKGLVKSEIVIQVNDPLENEKVPQDSFCVTTLNGDEQVDGFPPPVLQEAPNFPPPPPPLDSEDDQCAFSPPPPPPPPDFTNAGSAGGRKWANVKTDDRPQGTPSDKQQPTNQAAANLAKILTQHILPRRKALENEEEKSTLSSSKSPPKSPPKSPQCVRKPTENSSPSNGIATKPKGFSYAPMAPKLPPFPKKVQANGVFVPINGDSAKMDPPPPKLPQTLPPKVNGRSSPSDVDFNTTTVVPVTDGSAKVDKNNPNVRKLVYSTYRGLLGAYNNKANDMISTLPRNMVREDQGVAKQLESMALQGGLEKLNGRTNPNVEQE